LGFSAFEALFPSTPDVFSIPSYVLFLIQQDAGFGRHFRVLLAEGRLPSSLKAASPSGILCLLKFPADSEDWLGLAYPFHQNRQVSLLASTDSFIPVSSAY
jgi:hypothetical protein